MAPLAMVVVWQLSEESRACAAERRKPLNADPLGGGDLSESNPFRKRFIETVLDPAEWERSASKLLEAAKLLEPGAREALSHPEGVYLAPSRDNPVAVYFMLCAYAIENYLKARIIRDRAEKFREQLESTAKLPTEISTHQLRRLAHISGRRGLAAGYADILERLTRSAVWYGRYPVPTNPDFLNPLTTDDEGEPISRTMYTSDDIREVHRVFRELGVILGN